MYFKILTHQLECFITTIIIHRKLLNKLNIINITSTKLPNYRLVSGQHTKTINKHKLKLNTTTYLLTKHVKINERPTWNTFYQISNLKFLAENINSFSNFSKVPNSNFARSSPTPPRRPADPSRDRPAVHTRTWETFPSNFATENFTNTRPE